jgi:hypothetical protein
LHFASYKNSEKMVEIIAEFVIIKQYIMVIMIGFRKTQGRIK